MVQVSWNPTFFSRKIQ